jgi:hypothetical protein
VIHCRWIGFEADAGLFLRKASIALPTPEPRTVNACGGITLSSRPLSADNKSRAKRVDSFPALWVKAGLVSVTPDTTNAPTTL